MKIIDFKLAFIYYFASPAASVVQARENHTQSINNLNGQKKEEFIYQQVKKLSDTFLNSDNHYDSFHKVFDELKNIQNEDNYAEHSPKIS